MKFQLTGKRVVQNLRAIEHGKRVRRMTEYRPGDIVAVHPMWGMHVAAGVPARVLRVDLDHDHARRYEHDQKCYDAARIELTLVWGQKEDDSAVLRTREPQRHVTKVRLP